MISPLKKHTIGLTVSIIVFFAGAVGLWRFAVHMQAKKERVIAAKEQLKAYEENKKIFLEESEALSAIAGRVVSLEAYRITPATTPELLSALEALAQAHAVEFAITTVQTPGAQNVGQRLLVDFSAKGAPGRVDAFLLDLGRQSYQTKFTKFALFAIGPDSESALPRVAEWEVLASMQIVSY